MNYARNLTWERFEDLYSHIYKKCLIGRRRALAPYINCFDRDLIEHPFLSDLIDRKKISATEIDDVKEIINSFRKLEGTFISIDFETHLDWTFEEKTKAHFKLEKALKLIRDHCPNAYQYVLKSLLHISLRKTSHQGSFISSRSKSNIEKWCQIDNILHYDVLEIAMAVIHEAIHNYIWILERRYPIFQKAYWGKSEKVTSPWSGDIISIGAYAHTILVWFGLFNFLNTVPKSPLRQRHHEFIKSGFEGKPFDSLVNIASPHLVSSFLYIEHFMSAD